MVEDSIEVIEEPVIRATIMLPAEFVGAIMKLCRERRGTQTGNKYLSPTRVQLIYELPLAEVVMDFFDRLKSLTKGYASLDYEYLELRPAEADAIVRYREANGPFREWAEIAKAGAIEKSRIEAVKDRIRF